MAHRLQIDNTSRDIVRDNKIKQIFILDIIHLPTLDIKFIYIKDNTEFYFSFSKVQCQFSIINFSEFEQKLELEFLKFIRVENSYFNFIGYQITINNIIITIPSFHNVINLRPIYCSFFLEILDKNNILQWKSNNILKESLDPNIIQCNFDLIGLITSYNRWNYSNLLEQIYGYNNYDSKTLYLMIPKQFISDILIQKIFLSENKIIAYQLVNTKNYIINSENLHSMSLDYITLRFDNTFFHINMNKKYFFCGLKLLYRNNLEYCIPLWNNQVFIFNDNKKKLDPLNDILQTHELLRQYCL